MHGNDHARRWLTLALVLTLAADSLFPRQGPGAEVVSASFWLYGIAIAAFTVRQLVLRVRYGSEVPILKWVLLALFVAFLFVSAAFLDRGSAAAQICNLAFAACALALLVLAIRDWLRGARARRTAT